MRLTRSENSIAIRAPLSLLRGVEVGSQAPRLAQVDVAGPVVVGRVVVDEHPQHARQRARHRDLARAEQRHAVEADVARRDRGELGVEVGGEREDAAHDVLGREGVALDDLVHEPLGGREDGLAVVALDAGGAAEGEEAHRREIMSVVLRVALVLAVVLLAACGGGERLEAALPRGRDGLTVSSPDFRAGGPLPRRFSCAGAGDRPVLGWSGVPRRARELVLIVVDPDATGFVHWTVYGMRPSTRGLRATGLPPAAKQGKSSAGTLGWTPACPPQGDAPHHYEFTLYWLRRRTGLTEGVEPGEVVAALKGDVGGRGQLVGRFGRS